MKFGSFVTTRECSYNDQSIIDFTAETASSGIKLDTAAHNTIILGTAATHRFYEVTVGVNVSCMSGSPVLVLVKNGMPSATDVRLPITNVGFSSYDLIFDLPESTTLNLMVACGTIALGSTCQCPAPSNAVTAYVTVKTLIDK